MAEPLRWGILSTGRIAGTFARGLSQTGSGILRAVGSRSAEAAERFGAEHDIPARHGSYEALLADPDVQAVYIATPHPAHAEWAIRTAEAGKHILCEKPMTMNHAEAMAVIEAARRHGVFFMEAFMYRCHPQTARLVELIREGRVGEVRVIQATFSFRGGDNPKSRLLDPQLGGGGILDVGCYTMSMSRLIAGAAQGGGFADPEEIDGAAHLGDTGVDEYAVAAAKFPGGILAQLATGVRVGQENVVRIYGTEGQITVPSPWGLGGKSGTTSLLVSRDGKTEEVRVAADRGAYAYEADTVATHRNAGQAPSPAMSWADSLGNMRALDRWRESVGLAYPSEDPERMRLPVHRRALVRRKDAPMTYGTIQGVDKPVSRLVMGTQGPYARASVMYDDFFELGGTAFDTAFQYGHGRNDGLLGTWVKNRGLREQVVILAKGAHSPNCFPEAITTQLEVSLDRLRTSYVDLYCMHRDNPEVPVGEFVDVLNDHVKAGRIRRFGGSNWTIARLDEANAYAAKKGLQGFSILSNNFSLARMVEAPWRGCLAASDPEFRAWLERTGTPLLPWSSQARGFFSPGRARPEDTSDPELVRSWYAPDNFERLGRATALAGKLGVDAINVALAYVLAQPFPTFPIVGPRDLAETLSCCSALRLELSPGQLRWLNLEADSPDG